MHTFIHRHNTLTIAGIALFFVALLGYAVIEVRTMVTGPQLSIETPDTEMITSSDSVIAVRGSSKNVANLSINGSSAPLTTDGTFERILLLAPGHNTIILTARDALGRLTRTELAVMYIPTPTATVPTHITEFTNNDELL